MINQTELLTADGQLVATVPIPAFKTPPQAILFGGTRLFLLNGIGEYREGFWVAAIQFTAQDVPKNEIGVTKKAESVIKHEGDDSLLFGLPKDLEEAVETFIDFYGKSEDFVSIIDQDEGEFTAYAHHGAGQFMRNSWFLWWHPDHGYKEWPKSKPPLIEYFNGLGIGHADDMSGIILSAAWHKIHNKPFDINIRINEAKNHWRQYGFADGIYKNIKSK